MYEFLIQHLMKEQDHNQSRNMLIQANEVIFDNVYLRDLKKHQYSNCAQKTQQLEGQQSCRESYTLGTK